MTTTLFRARRLLAAPGRWIADGGLVVEGGRVRALLDGPGAVARARAAAERVVELDEGVLTPGLVNAHAHLELTALAGRLAPGPDFVGWVRALVAARAALGADELEAGARAGADRLLAGGTTTVGDVDSTGASARALRGHPLRGVLYREVLDAGDPARTAAEIERLARAPQLGPRLLEGVSPHAPHTCGPALLCAAAAAVRERGLRASVHWAESAEEQAWLERGEGPFAGILPARPADAPRGPGAGLAALAAAGLIGPRTSLVHANLPAPGDPERVAAAGAVVVHCPGTHAWFERAPFDLERWRASGATLALGTDSLASNDALDLRHELVRLRAAHPALPPAEAWAMATTGAARALGLAGEVGALEPGARADLVWRGAESGEPGACLDELTAVPVAVHAVWIGGAPATPAPPPRDGATP